MVKNKLSIFFPPHSCCMHTKLYMPALTMSDQKKNVRKYFALQNARNSSHHLHYTEKSWNVNYNHIDHNIT